MRDSLTSSKTGDEIFAEEGWSTLSETLSMRLFLVGGSSEAVLTRLEYVRKPVLLNVRIPVEGVRRDKKSLITSVFQWPWPCRV